MGFGPLKRLGALTSSLSESLSSKGLFTQNGPPIAIDFGVSGLKVLQIAPGEPPTLLAAAFVPTPDPFLNNHGNRFEFQIEALPRMIRSGGFKGNRAVCAIPAGQTFCKHMQFQKGDGVPLESMVEVAVSQQLGCDPSALVYRHVEVNPGAASGKAEVICTAVPRVFINKLLAAMKACKLELVGVHAEFAALLRGFDYITQRAEDRALTTLYLDLGYSTTKVLIASGKNPVFARAIELGGRHLDEAVADQEELEIAEARRRRLACDELVVAKGNPKPGPRVIDNEMSQMADALKRGGGDILAATLKASSRQERRHGDTAPGLTQDVLSTEPAPAPLDADLTEPLEILTDEIQLCLRYYDSLFPGKRVDRTVFIGGEARHRGLCQHVARILRLPAQIADPLARVSRTGKEPSPGIDLREAQPGWAVALGLSLSPTDL